MDKYIRAAIKEGDLDKVKVSFSKDPFTPAEFTSIFMGILETYTLALLETNERKDVYEHFNNVFGIFLNKILSDDEIYKNSELHKKGKEVVDKTIGRPETEQDMSKTEENRLAAYILAKDILTNEVGLTDEAADLILNKRLNQVSVIS